MDFDTILFTGEVLRSKAPCLISLALTTLYHTAMESSYLPKTPILALVTKPSNLSSAVWISQSIEELQGSDTDQITKETNTNSLSLVSISAVFEMSVVSFYRQNPSTRPRQRATLVYPRHGGLLNHNCRGTLRYNVELVR